MDNIDTTRSWYENAYNKEGFKSQRLYPNEELLRFMGRNFFNVPLDERKNIKILEVGCGSCSNLWMVAKENFNAYGMDLSEKSLELGRLMLKKWDVQAHLATGDMCLLAYEDSFFDAIVDVFSSYCLETKLFVSFLYEAFRTLKPGGKLFIYTPSTNSEAFIDHAPAVKIDEFTLNGIYRKDSPFYGNFYSFRFESIVHITQLLEENGFKINYCESIKRTYSGMKETFEHLSIEAIKQ